MSPVPLISYRNDKDARGDVEEPAIQSHIEEARRLDHSRTRDKEDFVRIDIEKAR